MGDTCMCSSAFVHVCVRERQRNSSHVGASMGLVNQMYVLVFRVFVRFENDKIMECHECVFEGSRFVISVSEIAQNLREGLFHRELFEGRRIFTSERALRIRQMKGTCSPCGY